MVGQGVLFYLRGMRTHLTQIFSKILAFERCKGCTTRKHLIPCHDIIEPHYKIDVEVT